MRTFALSTGVKRFLEELSLLKIAQPFGLNAPETIFIPRIDYRIDLWRAGWIVSMETLVLKSQRLIKFITDSLSHIFSKAIPSIWN